MFQTLKKKESLSFILSDSWEKLWVRTLQKNSSRQTDDDFRALLSPYVQAAARIPLVATEAPGMVPRSSRWPQDSPQTSGKEGQVEFKPLSKDSQKKPAKKGLKMQIEEIWRDGGKGTGCVPAPRAGSSSRFPWVAPDKAGGWIRVPRPWDGNPHSK